MTEYISGTFEEKTGPISGIDEQISFISENLDLLSKTISELESRLGRVLVASKSLSKEDNVEEKQRKESSSIGRELAVLNRRIDGSHQSIMDIFKRLDL